MHHHQTIESVHHMLPHISRSFLPDDRGMPAHMPTLQYIPVPLNPQESVSALQGILPLLCISYILTQI